MSACDVSAMKKIRNKNINILDLDGTSKSVPNRKILPPTPLPTTKSNYLCILLYFFLLN